METGVLQAFEDSTTLPALINIILLINDSWLPLLDLEDEAISPQTIQTAINLMLQVMRPYLSQAALAQLPGLTTVPTAIETTTQKVSS